MYNDGIVFVANRISELNPKSKKDFEVFCKLQFTEMYCRSQDYEFCESSGSSLSRKIKTPFYNKITDNNYCIIDNILYNISRIDSTKKNLFLYLQKERKLNDN